MPVTSESSTGLLVVVPGCVFVNDFSYLRNHHVFEKATGEFSDDQSDSEEHSSDLKGQNQHCLEFRVVQNASKCNRRKRDQCKSTCSVECHGTVRNSIQDSVLISRDYSRGSHRKEGLLRFIDRLNFWNQPFRKSFRNRKSLTQCRSNRLKELGGEASRNEPAKLLVKRWE